MFTDRVRFRPPHDGSRWGGVILKFVAPPGGKHVDVVAPQIGFERSDGTGWDYLTEDELPPSSERLFSSSAILSAEDVKELLG